MGLTNKIFSSSTFSCPYADFRTGHSWATRFLYSGFEPCTCDSPPATQPAHATRPVRCSTRRELSLAVTERVSHSDMENPPPGFSGVPKYSAAAAKSKKQAAGDASGSSASLGAPEHFSSFSTSISPSSGEQVWRLCLFLGSK